MRFLANENFPRAAVEALEKEGHTVTWMRVAAPGASDAEVMSRAMREGAILLTFDKDFGEIARTTALPAMCGVVLFRMPMPPLRDAGRRLADQLTSRNDWAGHFSVIEPGRVRMRPLLKT